MHRQRLNSPFFVSSFFAWNRWSPVCWLSNVIDKSCLKQAQTGWSLGNLFSLVLNNGSRREGLPQHGRCRDSEVASYEKRKEARHPSICSSSWSCHCYVHVISRGTEGSFDFLLPALFNASFNWEANICPVYACSASLALGYSSFSSWPWHH